METILISRCIMRFMLRGIRKIIICFSTIVSKLRWGKSLQIDGLFYKKRDTQIIISCNGTLILGNSVSFQRNVSLTSIGGVLNIGNNVAFNRNCIVICRNNVLIEDDVLFGPNVTIYDHDHAYTDEGIQTGFTYGSVTIKKGCWIAANVTILKNTYIGEGSVIGAGCIVKGDIPPHSIVTSNRDLQIKPIIKH